MPIDTSMYQNYRGGQAAAGLSQGIGQGLQIAQQRRQNQRQDAQDVRAQETFDAQKTAANKDRIGKMASSFVGFMSKQPEAVRAKIWGEQGGQIANQYAEAYGLPPEAVQLNDFSDQGLASLGQSIQHSMMTPEQKRAEQWKEKNFQQNERKIGASNSGEKTNAPAGYRFLADGNLEAIPGGPVATKATKGEIIKGKQKEIKDISAGIVTQDIGRALTMLDDSNTSTSGFGKYGSWVPGTDAYDLNNMLQSIQANVGFDKLQSMREASPTGGALGAVSGSEMDLLKAALGNLSNNQSEDMLRDNLRRVNNTYLDIIHGKDSGPKRQQLSFDNSGKPKEAGNASVEASSPQTFKTSEIEWE